MLPRVYTTFVTTTADTVRLTYHCEGCGADSPAIVSAVSRGYGEALYGIGGASARQQSADTAVAGLPAAIERTVGLAGCPRCSRRAPAVARRSQLRAYGLAFTSWVGVVIGLAIFGGAIAVVQGNGVSERLIGAAVVVVGLIAALPLALWKYRRLVHEAQTLVVWDPTS